MTQRTTRDFNELGRLVRLGGHGDFNEPGRSRSIAASLKKVPGEPGYPRELPKITEVIGLVTRVGNALTIDLRLAHGRWPSSATAPVINLSRECSMTKAICL